MISYYVISYLSEEVNARSPGAESGSTPADVQRSLPRGGNHNLQMIVTTYA